MRGAACSEKPTATRGDIDLKQSVASKTVLLANRQRRAQLPYVKVRFWGALAAVLVTACGFPNHRHDRKVHEQIPSSGSGLSNALYQSLGVEMAEGNRVRLADNGVVFDEVVAAIEGAKKTVHIELFIWRKSEPSDRVVKALVERTKQGVSCRIIVDPLFSVGFEKEVRPELVEAGCDVRFFNPGSQGSKIRAFTKRTHRKLVIVDGALGITGGFGIWKSWLGDGMTTEEWRDSNIVVEGPAVREMQQAFAENWQQVGGGLLPAEDIERPAPKGRINAAFIASTPTSSISDAERMTQLMVGAATKRIWIANSYFIPSAAVAQMLIEKAKAGVDVRVLAPGKKMDMKPVRLGQLSVYKDLLEQGVRIWEYQPSMMHSKTMLVDDHLIVVGSTNLDVLSRQDLEEGSLIVEDPELAKELEARMNHDFKYSLEIQWSWWKKRGLAERIGPALSPLIGRFL